MRQTLIAGNWKMNKLVSDALPWSQELTRQLGAARSGVELLLCVPATHLHALNQALKGSPVRLGGQDLSAHESGAYTGEISGAMLRDAGADFVLVGHSERRQYHGEDDVLLNAKIRAAQGSWLTPILCVGESADERDAGQANQVVLSQLEGALHEIDIASSKELIVAYEPVWSIGTGRTATPEDAQAMCSVIRAWLTDRYPAMAANMRILYGGSMKPDNAAELLEQTDINGGLIGGASLEVEDLLAIYEAAAA